MKKIIFLSSILLLFLFVPVNAKNEKSQGNDNSSNKEKVKERLKDFEKPSNTNSRAPGQQKKVQPQQQTPQSGPRLLQEPQNIESGTEVGQNFTKSNQGKGQTNSKLYKEKVSRVSENLQIIGEELEDESTYTPELEQAAEEIEEVAEESEETTEEVAEAIEQVENQNRFQRMLIGTDYKNLGQLRSNLVKNENQIRKLTRNVERVQDEETQTVLQEQLATLTQERERIKTVITENESGFSILGWARKLFAGYNSTPIETPEEEELLEDVADVIDEEVVEEVQEEVEVQPTPTQTVE